MPDISVIIPLAANENAWHELLDDLCQLPAETEIIFAVADGVELPLETIALPHAQVAVISGKPGRGEQMNAGARAAKGEFLWFLHADSKFTPDLIPALLRAINDQPDSLLYFDLNFLNDASPLMRFNDWGVHFRSRVFKCPFGDQGFCIQQTLFHELGGYPEGELYGEDHLFVWRARQQGLQLHPVGAALYTSARKYKMQGWLRTTLLHQYLWLKQAWPEWRKLMKGARS